MVGFVSQGIIALDVLPAFHGAFMSLGGVGVNGFQGLNIRNVKGIGDA